MHAHCDEDEHELTESQLRSLHSKFDANGDGKVSLQELLEFSRETSKAMSSKDIHKLIEETDTSKDGKLSLDEHMSDILNHNDAGSPEEQKELDQMKQLETAKFKAADKNGDGSLDLDELPGLFYPETHDPVLQVHAEDTLRRKDQDNDGLLTKHEFWDVEPGHEGPAELSEDEHEDFAKLDVNGDGKLDAGELKHWEFGRFHTEKAIKNFFAAADKNGDGHLSADEVAGAKEEIMTSDVQYHLHEWREHHEL